MQWSTFLSTLAYYLSQYAPEELDQSMKPKDSANIQTQRNRMFDAIVVGAGSAGTVVANRISENPFGRVLLIEAGGDEDYITDVPLLAGMFRGTMYDWNYTTTKQEAVCQNLGGSCPFVQGHVMGGTSTIDNLLYIRGNRLDYDSWAAGGNVGWSYKDVLPYFIKSENITIPTLMDSEYHGTDGPMMVGNANYISELELRQIKEGLAANIPYNDYNGAFQYGQMYTQMHISDGRRWSASRGYLDSARDRDNLVIFKNTLVTKILINEDRRAIGVRCVTDGEEYDMFAVREVIVSAGVINSPKLLMLSGIGPRDHLKSLGIPVLANLPVGENLVDSPGVIIDFSVNPPDVVYDDEKIEEEIMKYAKCATGLLTAPTRTDAAMLNSSATVQTEDMIPDMYSQVGSKINLFNKPNVPSTLINTYEIIWNPCSRGTVRLQSKDYRDPPLIDPKYYSCKSDLIHIQKAINLLVNFYKTTNWTAESPALIVPSECNYNGTVTEEFTTCFIKYNSYLGLTGTSTAKMGPANDPTSVVDPTLKVHTINSLRVVDASVIPTPIRAFPHATAVMIGERVSAMIKEAFTV